MRTSLLIGSYILFVAQLAVAQNTKRESVLDRISHIEDSIHMQIDTLPMLCSELNMQGEFIDIGNCKLYCEIAGKGTPIVLINGGSGGSHHCFHPWFGEVEKWSKVIYYDQRGCGQSGYVEGDGYTFRQAVDDLEKLRQKLGIAQWVVCGYSYGGALAQYYTATYPEHVLGMVLIGSAPVLGTDIPPGSRQRDFISEEERLMIKGIYDLYYNKEIDMQQLMVNKDINGDWKRQHFYKPSKENAIRTALYEWTHDKGFNRKMGQSYYQYDFRGVFANSPIPTLICEGKWDLTWTAQKGEILRKSQPNARFQLFENSGHTIFSEESELFFASFKDFVSALNPSSNDDVKNWKEHAASIIIPQEELFARETVFFTLFEKEGVDSACNYYNTFKKNDNKQLFSEEGISNLAYTVIGKKDNDTALKVLEMGVDQYPNSEEMHEQLAKLYYREENTAKVKEHCLKALEANPNNRTVKDILESLDK